MRKKKLFWNLSPVGDRDIWWWENPTDSDLANAGAALVTVTDGSCAVCRRYEPREGHSLNEILVDLIKSFPGIKSAREKFVSNLNSIAVKVGFGSVVLDPNPQYPARCGVLRLDRLNRMIEVQVFNLDSNCCPGCVQANGMGARPVSLKKHYPELVGAMHVFVNSEDGVRLLKEMEAYIPDDEGWGPHGHLEYNLPNWGGCEHAGAIYLTPPCKGGVRWVLSGRGDLAISAYYDM